MKNLLIVFSTLSFASLGSAALIATEGFDYANDTRLGSTETGGTGWRSSGSVGYYTEGLSTQPSQMDQIDYTWQNSYTGYTYLNSGKSVQNINGGGGLTGARFLENGIDMDSGFLYFSAVVRPQDDDGTNFWTNLIFRDGSTTTANGRHESALFQLTGSNQLKVAGGNVANDGEDGALLGSAFTEGSEYLLIGKIAFGAGTDNDVVSASLFSNGSDVSSEPVSWGVEVNATLTGTIDNFAIRMNGESKVGSLRIGDTYSAVIPEPGTFALFGLAGVALLIGIHRRR